jgi:hypothetical protein
MATTPQITEVLPAPNAKGIPIGNPVTVIFDQEMDLTSLNTGTIVLTGPDEAPLFGPHDVTPFDTPGFEDEDILSSPYFKGWVKATISYSRVDASGGIVDDDEEDVTGDGTLWRTVAFLTPDKPLKPNVKYTAIVLGDEAPTDDFDTGVKTRTVFDTVFIGSGSGRLTYYGGYTGEVQTSYTVEITGGGPTGTATYIWWNNNDPLTTYQGTTTTGERELEDGVFITCDRDGSFTIGDKFTVVVVPAIVMPNTYQWDFYTGSGAVTTPPSTQSTSGIDSITTNVIGSGTEETSSFGVSEITPEDGEYGVEISTDPYTGEEITITFSADIDPTTFTASVLDVRSEVANGDDIMFTATGDLEYTATLSSARVISIVLDPGQLYTNNIVILEIDESLSDTDGNSLAEDYESYFSTPYTPLYTSLRRVRLDLGPLITDVSDETIMLAILEASLYADAISFSTTISNTTYFHHARREFTTCLAELMLVKALLSDGGTSDRMSKELGDLKVSRGGINSLIDTRNSLEDCVARWEISVNTGGEITPNTSVKPQITVKGAAAEDNIVVRRQWEPTSTIETTNSRSAGNAYRYVSGRRDYKTFRSRNGWSRGGRENE